MKAQIPFASDIERMGLLRAPVMATAPSSTASKAYWALHCEIQERMKTT
jgi:chromosome partitioning protein